MFEQAPTPPTQETLPDTDERAVTDCEFFSVVADVMPASRSWNISLHLQQGRLVLSNPTDILSPIVRLW